MSAKPITMEIGGLLFVEAKPPKRGIVCEKCVFDGAPVRCGLAIEASPAVFGGNCQDRDVMYRYFARVTVSEPAEAQP